MTGSVRPSFEVLLMAYDRGEGNASAIKGLMMSLFGHISPHNNLYKTFMRSTRNRDNDAKVGQTTSNYGQTWQFRYY